MLAVGCDGLRKCALLPFRNNFTLMIGGIDGAGRYCPACIEESPFPAAWGRVLWDIPIVDACPSHGLDLVSHSCLTPRRCGSASAPNLFGVCPSCGSVSYRCSQPSARRATGDRLIIAAQMAELVEAVSGGKEFDRGVTAEAVLCHLAEEFGSVLEASRFFRMDVNQLYQMGARPKIPVDLLMTICVATGANLVHLIDGKIERAYQPSDSIPKARRTKIRNAELALAFQEVAGEMPGMSLRELARSLRITSRRLEVILPDLAATIREEESKKVIEMAGRRRARRQRLVHRLHEIKREVEATGGRLTLRLARSKTGDGFWTGTDSSRILKLVMRGKL
ncbi:hypothetical protein P3T19_004687 [Paraburkholderia sp. GAS205]